MNSFEPKSLKQAAYEAYRAQWLVDHPLVTREEIEAGKVEAPLMTPQEIIDAAAKLIMK